nr:hypothetical protein GCM10020063_096590 [Dactylosporangium thailandense]
MTKDYPDEPASGLDEPGAFRLDIAVPKAEFARVSARRPCPRHPVYGGAGMHRAARVLSEDGDQARWAGRRVRR